MCVPAPAVLVFTYYVYMNTQVEEQTGASKPSYLDSAGWPSRTASATHIDSSSGGAMRPKHPHPGTVPASAPLGRRVMAPNPRAVLPASAAKQLAAVDFGYVASAMLNYTWLFSAAQQGPRANVSDPAYGLVAWGVSAPSWLVRLVSSVIAALPGRTQSDV